jgi:hypothetical protein
MHHIRPGCLQLFNTPHTLGSTPGSADPATNRYQGADVMPELKLDDLAKTVSDGVYITVGAAVLAIQKLQVRRQELIKQLKPLVGDARDQFDKVAGTVSETVEEQVKTLESRIESVESQIESLLEKLQDELPEPAGELVKQIQVAAKEARDQVLALVNRAA